jgi:hypothetical protein
MSPALKKRLEEVRATNPVLYPHLLSLLSKYEGNDTAMHEPIYYPNSDC